MVSKVSKKTVKTAKTVKKAKTGSKTKAVKATTKKVVKAPKAVKVNKKVASVKAKQVEEKVVKSVIKEVPLDKSLFAVVKVKGEQIKLFKNEIVEVNRTEGKIGDKFEITDVLLIQNGDDLKIGQPTVKDAVALFEIVNQKKGKKIDGFKYKAKSRYRKSFGFRATITEIKFLGLK